MGRLQECLYQTCFSLKGGSRVVSWLGWGVPSWAVHPLGALSAPDGEQVWNKSTTKPWEPCYKFQACKMSAQRLAWDITLPVCVHLTGSFYIYLFISPDLEWNCGLGQKKKRKKDIFVRCFLTEVLLLIMCTMGSTALSSADSWQRAFKGCPPASAPTSLLLTRLKCIWPWNKHGAWMSRREGGPRGQAVYKQASQPLCPLPPLTFLITVH